MIGGLQGENEDLNINYLKQKRSKNVGRKYREASGEILLHCAKWLRNFRSKRTTFSQPKANFTAMQKFPSAWSDLLAMAVTPSFQLRIVHRLKHWIVDFLSFETTYRMHKLNSKKCSKSG